MLLLLKPNPLQQINYGLFYSSGSISGKSSPGFVVPSPGVTLAEIRCHSSQSSSQTEGYGGLWTLGGSICVL